MAKPPTNSETDSRSQSRGPWIKESQQRSLLVLVSSFLLMTASYWFYLGGHRGQLIEIDRAEPLTAKYLVDVNKADWPDKTILQFLTPMVFHAADICVRVRHYQRPAIDEAVNFLRSILVHRAAHCTEVVAAAENDGLSRMTIYRTARLLKVRRKNGIWTLPPVNCPAGINNS